MSTESRNANKHHASREWFVERLFSAISLLLLVWLIFNLMLIGRGGYQGFGEFISMPLNGILTVMFFGCFGVYSFMAMKVVYEDYVHGIKARKVITALTGVANAAAFIGVLAAVLNI